MQEPLGHYRKVQGQHEVAIGAAHSALEAAQLHRDALEKKTSESFESSRLELRRTADRFAEDLNVARGEFAHALEMARKALEKRIGRLTFGVVLVGVVLSGSLLWQAFGA